MGKKKLATVNKNKKEKAIFEEKKVKHAGKGEGHLADMSVAALAEAEEIEKKRKQEEKELEKVAAGEVKTETKAKKAKKVKNRSRRYKALKLKIDSKKLYSLKEGVELLVTLANSKIDETVEIHLVTREEKLTGSVNLPHGTGKKQKVVIADDELIAEITKGKINFDILIAHPKMMPKIAKLARVLGPKGLMPNPKTGTISDKPEELKKKLEGGETRFKTETKAPLIHMVIGKISFGADKISANLEALIKAVKPSMISKAYLKSTHSPSIKLAVS